MNDLLRRSFLGRCLSLIAIPALPGPIARLLGRQRRDPGPMASPRPFEFRGISIRGDDDPVLREARTYKAVAFVDCTFQDCGVVDVADGQAMLIEGCTFNGTTVRSRERTGPLCVVNAHFKGHAPDTSGALQLGHSGFAARCVFETDGRVIARIGTIRISPDGNVFAGRE